MASVYCLYAQLVSSKLFNSCMRLGYNVLFLLPIHQYIHICISTCMLGKLSLILMMALFFSLFFLIQCNKTNDSLTKCSSAKGDILYDYVNCSPRIYQYNYMHTVATCRYYVWNKKVIGSLIKYHNRLFSHIGFSHFSHHLNECMQIDRVAFDFHKHKVFKRQCTVKRFVIFKSVSRWKWSTCLAVFIIRFGTLVVWPIHQM